MKRFKQNPIMVDLGLILIIAAYSAIIGAINYTDTYDDAFIIFRYAFNFARGNGFVYNQDLWNLSITTPLYGLILGVLGLLEPNAIPTISGLISSISLGLAGIAIYWYGKIHSHRLSGFLASILFVGNYLLIHTFGGEMLFLMALIMWAFVLYQLDKTILSSILLAISILTRPDAILAALVVGLHYVISRRKIPVREVMVAAVILTPFLFVSWLTYGSILPNTLSSRLAQSASGLWPSFTQGVVEWFRGLSFGNSRVFKRLSHFPDTLRILVFAPAGIPGLVLLPSWLLPLAWIALYMICYSLIGVPFYHWYIVPVGLGLSILVATGVAWIVHLGVKVFTSVAGARYENLARFGITTICFLPLVTGLYAHALTMRDMVSQQPDAAERIYTKAGRWLRANTSEDSSVGYFEIGHLGYYSHREIIDPLGLLDPQLVPMVAERDFSRAYEELRPDYIVFNPRFKVFSKYVESDWFINEYRKVKSISDPENLSLDIYQRHNYSP